MELIAEQGLKALPRALAALINEAMRLERERHLGVGAYARSEERRGYANGYQLKRVKTRVGELNLAVPQVREGGFYPQSLDKGLRSEQALAVAETYVSRVSTRKVARITEQRFVSDDPAGLKAARAAVFPAVPWQRCQFHQQQNAGAYVPCQDRRQGVAIHLRVIFNAPDAEEAKRLLERSVDQHEAKAPKLAEWVAEALPQGFAVFALRPPIVAARARPTRWSA